MKNFNTANKKVLYCDCEACSHGSIENQCVYFDFDWDAPDDVNISGVADTMMNQSKKMQTELSFIGISSGACDCV